jgi:small subunit ribosomal protein S17
MAAKGLAAAELRSSTEDELDVKLAEAKIELFNLRFQAATGQLESHGRLRAVRKEIARIYTVKQERELGIVREEKAELARGYRKVREGLVVSDKMDKTVVVEVEDRVKHPKYGKVIRRTKKYKAHDGENACGVGDRVLLMETRPLSATKRWRVAEILEKAK